MKIARPNLRALSLTALVFTAWLVSYATASANRPAELTAQEKRGKQIYLKGEGGEGEITAMLGTSDLELPASSFSCSNCHGLRGEGTREGGLQPPAINWAALTAPANSPLSGRKRPAYTEATLARAISEGIDPLGNRLHPGMPHYKMSASQMADLVAYLKKIGLESDAETGVSDDKVKIGAALPVTGPLAELGQDIKAAMAAYFNEVNSQGGVYGRRVELVTEDSRGEAQGTEEAMRRLIESAGVFALVGSYEPKESRLANEFLRKSEVPLIGPVTLSPGTGSVPNPFIFYLLPSFNDQARSLVDFIGTEGMRPGQKPARRIAVVYTGDSFDRDAIAGLKSQAALYSMTIVGEHAYTPGNLKAAVNAEEFNRTGPDVIFFFGNADDFKTLAIEMDRAKVDAALVSSAVMTGRGAFSLPAQVAARTYLSYPGSIPSKDDFSEFLSLMQKSGVALRNVAFQAAAFASAKVFVEALKSSGKQLSRPVLVKSLEQLQNYRTGVMPPVTFGPNRRVGAAGSYIVGIDLANKQFVPIGERVAPKGNTR